MNRIFSFSILDFTMTVIVAIGSMLILYNTGFMNDFALPASLLNLNTIFLSILIEALPFVLIGVLIAGTIQIFVTEAHIQKWIPENKVKAVFMSCTIGALFPACECGIVPIVRRLISKGVPIHAAIGFMLTGPLINPIVIASTYMAFGNDFRMAGFRMILGFVIAIIVALTVGVLFKGRQLKDSVEMNSRSHFHTEKSLPTKLWSMLTHSIDEFFDMAKFLVIGAFLAAVVQTYLPARVLLELGSGPIASLLVMMGLAYVLSLCSEADAFIGASFRGIFPASSILGFLIFGPMIDLKNTIMMLSVFRFRFVFGVLGLVVCVIIVIITALQGYL